METMPVFSPTQTLPQWRRQLERNSSEPLYRQIAALVEQDLAEGRLPPGTHLPSLRSLSEGLGVGMVTVRKAFQILNDAGVVISRRGSGSMVADPAAPSDEAPSARPLRLAVVFAEIETGYPFFRPMLEAIQQPASRVARPIQLQLIQLEASIDDAREIAHRLPLHACDGLLMMSPVNPVLIAMCRQHALPYVLLFNHLNDGVSRCISPDYHTGMLNAIAHLKRRGRRRVALVTADPSRFSTGQVLQAFALAMKNQQLSFDRDLVRAGAYDQSTGYEIAAALLDLPDPPDAMVFSSDFQACGGCMAAEQRTLKPGRDVGIIACGGVLGEKEWPYELATINLGLAMMGAVAVQTLRQLIGNESPPYFQTIASTFQPGATS